MLPIRTRREFLCQLGSGLLTAAACGRIKADDLKVPDIRERLKAEVGGAPLSMQFDGNTPDEIRAWQAKFAARLRELLGPHQPPKTWKTVVRSTTELEDHTRQDLVLQAEGYPPLPVFLLLPKGAQGKKTPGMLALHGHTGTGHHIIAGNEKVPVVAQQIESGRCYGRELARRGYAVAVPNFTPFGDRLGSRAAFGKTDPCGDTFLRMMLLGKLLIAENLRDALWAFELLARRADVDADRMGCAGLSYGGRMTMLTSALEPRIKVAVISGALNVMQERISKPYSCGAQVIPGLLKYGDVPEISSLIAPRYCLFEVGSKDGLIDPAWAETALKRIRKAYSAYGKEDHLLVDRFDGGHQFNGKVAYPLIKKVLMTS